MNFLPPIADARDFPVATITVNANKIYDNGHTRLLPKRVTERFVVDRGRTALYVLANSISSKKVWIPAYHCPAMIEPFLYAQKEICFYPLDKALNADVKYLIGQLQPNDVLLAVRYFGFDTNIELLVQECKKKGVLVIEDLAHAAITTQLYADIAITSLTKFYPDLTAGELMYTNECNMQETIRSECKRINSHSLSRFKQVLRKIASKFGLQASSKFKYLKPEVMYRAGAKSIQRCVAALGQDEITRKRREHYQLIADCIGQVAWGRVLFELVENTTPYVVPVLIEDEEYFSILRNAGIQVLRWEELSTEIQCPLVNHFRRHLIQLPCHQDLTNDELNIIKQTILRSF